MTYKNTFQRGISIEEQESHIPAEEGMPMHGGIPQTTAEELAKQDKFRGIPIPGPGMLPDAEDVTSRCMGVTKKGARCKAYTTNDGNYCMVHGDQT